MGKVINFSDHTAGELEGWSYFEWGAGYIGVKSNEAEFSIGEYDPDNTDEIAIELYDELFVTSAKEMAKLLWAMAYYLDPDQKWADDSYYSLDSGVSHD